MVIVMVMVTDRIALNETIGMKWGDTKWNDMMLLVVKWSITD